MSNTTTDIIIERQIMQNVNESAEIHRKNGHWTWAPFESSIIF